MRGARHGCPRTDGGGNGKPRRAWFTGFSAERFSLPLDLVSGADSAASLSGVDRKVRMARVWASTSLGSCRRVGDCDHRDAGGGVHASGLHAGWCKWLYAREERAPGSYDSCPEATGKRGVARGLVRGWPLIRPLGSSGLSS